MPLAGGVAVVSYDLIGVVDAPRPGVGPSRNIDRCIGSHEVEEPVCASVIWIVVCAHDPGAVVHAVWQGLRAAGYDNRRHAAILLNQNALDFVPGALKGSNLAGF